MKGFQKFLFVLSLLAAPLLVTAQEDIEDLLNEEVMVENPVYKPVIALGYGVCNFYGDVRNGTFINSEEHKEFISPAMGTAAFKVNISTFVDPKRYYKANFFLLYGKLSANQRSYENIFLDQNLNFKTDIVDFGINFEYGFDHFFKHQKFVKPFISAGIENIQFTPKGDLKNAAGLPYNYWSDGTIRDIKEGESGSIYSKVIFRDYEFEEDLRRSNSEKYSQNSFAFPIDAGIDFKVSDRVTCRLGTSVHITNSDFLDNVKSGGKDMFTFSYFSLHLDLFSQPKTMIIEKMFAELEIDDVMFDDEDGRVADAMQIIDEFHGQIPGTRVQIRQWLIE